MTFSAWSLDDVIGQLLSCLLEQYNLINEGKKSYWQFFNETNIAILWKNRNFWRSS